MSIKPVDVKFNHRDMKKIFTFLIGSTLFLLAHEIVGQLALQLIKANL